MNVVVTGATSLLGGEVASQLAARGDHVTCFQRRPNLVGLVDHLGDIRDADQVAAALDGQDAVVHLAALVAPRMAWSDAVAVNVLGTANVQRGSAACGAFVHVSTPSVAFHDVAAVGEGAEPAAYVGHDAYARSKAIAERSVLVDAALGSVPTVVLRPHLVWGPGDTQLVGRIVARAREGRLVLPDHGRALIDTTFVDDAAAAIVAGLDAAMTQGSATGRALVVTGGDPRPVGEIVTGILEAAGLPTRIRSVPAPLAAVAGRLSQAWWPGDEPPLTHFAARQLSLAHWFDQRQTQALLDWKPEVSVDAGMERLAQWFTQQS